MSTAPAPAVTGFVDVTFIVEPNYAGWRLDRYLCEKIRRLSRTRVQRILERSLVADRPLKPSTRVHPGLTFTLRRRAQAEPEVPEDVVELYLDASLLVLDKPAGLPIHPTARYHHNTLVKLLERRHGPGAPGGPCAPARPRDLRAARVRPWCRGLPGPDACLPVRRGPQGVPRRRRGPSRRTPSTWTRPSPRAPPRCASRSASTPAPGKPARTRFVVERRFVRDGAPFARAALLPGDRAPAPDPRPRPRGRLPARGRQDLRPRPRLLRPLQQALPRARGLGPAPPAPPRPARRPARLPPSGDRRTAGSSSPALPPDLSDFCVASTGVG